MLTRINTLALLGFAFFVYGSNAEAKSCAELFDTQAISKPLQMSAGSMTVRSSLRSSAETETRNVTVQVLAKSDRQDLLIIDSPDHARGAMAIKDGQIIRIEDGVRTFEFALPKTIDLANLTVSSPHGTSKMIETVYEANRGGGFRQAQTFARVHDGSLIVERWFVLNEGKRNEERVNAKFTFRQLSDLGAGGKEFRQMSMVFDIHRPATQPYMEGGPVTLTTPIALSAQ